MCSQKKDRKSGSVEFSHFWELYKLKGRLYVHLLSYLLGIENSSIYDMGIPWVYIKIRFVVVGYESSCFKVMENKLRFCESPWGFPSCQVVIYSNKVFSIVWATDILSGFKDIWKVICSVFDSPFR